MSEARVYTQRINARETVYSASGRSSNARKLLMLGGDGSTSPAGEYYIDIVDTFLRYFDLPYSDPIATNYRPLRIVFPHTPQVIATPLSAAPVLMTTQVQMRELGDISLEQNERVLTWDLDGGDPVFSPLDIVPPHSYASLVFLSWDQNGQPVAGVEFAWQLLGEARFLWKGYF